MNSQINRESRQQIPDYSIELIQDQTQNGQPIHPSIKPLLLRVREVVLVTGFSRSKIYQMIAEGALPCVRHGKSVRVLAEGLNHWIETNGSVAQN